MLTRFHQISFHNGIHAQGRDARTEKTAETYILRVGFFLNILSLGIDARDFDVNAEPYAHFGPGEERSAFAGAPGSRAKPRNQWVFQRNPRLPVLCNTGGYQRRAHDSPGKPEIHNGDHVRGVLINQAEKFLALKKFTSCAVDLQLLIGGVDIEEEHQPH